MELSASIMPWVSLGAMYLDPDDCIIFEHAAFRGSGSTQQIEWSQSACNPLNKINSLQVAEWHWSIDGCGSLGTQFFLRPTISSEKSIPLRVDLFIPDQAKHPAILRSLLGSNAAFYLRGSAVNQLEITRYILKVLEDWSARSRFEAIYPRLPFGSRIVIESIGFSTSSAKVRILPNLDLEKHLWSVHDLGGASESLPPSIPLRSLRLVRQLHDTISLVEAPTAAEAKLFIFKSSTTQPRFIYHELRNLLTLPPHPNIMSRPSHVVISQTFRQDDEKVYGFLLAYYATGNLASRLIHDSQNRTISSQTRLRWSQQITSALLHIHSSPVKFYSELKPDNVLLTPSDDILLIDFEQHANWETFSAPEIYHFDNLAKLLGLDCLPLHKERLYSDLLVKKRANINQLHKTSSYEAWEFLDDHRQELAMVYPLGKLMWCIFEGCSHTVNTLKEDYFVPITHEFPEFYHAPLDIQNLIKNCTQGSPDWRRKDFGLVRVGDMFYPKEGIADGDYHHITPKVSMMAARNISERYIHEMESYFESLCRWEAGNTDQLDIEVLGFPKRPHLRTVLRILTGISA